MTYEAPPYETYRSVESLTDMVEGTYGGPPEPPGSGAGQSWRRERPVPMTQVTECEPPSLEVYGVRYARRSGSRTNDSPPPASVVISNFPTDWTGRIAALAGPFSGRAETSTLQSVPVGNGCQGALPPMRYEHPQLETYGDVEDLTTVIDNGYSEKPPL